MVSPKPKDEAANKLASILALELTDHKHDYLLDVEVILTDDVEPQPRSQVFLECVGTKNVCPFILRGDEIIDYIQKLEAELRRLRNSGHGQA